MSGERIYPVPIKPASAINSWRDWPDDVREIIRDWNGRCGLSFVWLGAPDVFKCWDCEAFCAVHRHGAAVFRNREWLCDDCLIERARAGYKPPEPFRLKLSDIWRGRSPRPR